MNGNLSGNRARFAVKAAVSGFSAGTWFRRVLQLQRRRHFWTCRLEMFLHCQWWHTLILVNLFLCLESLAVVMDVLIFHKYLGNAYPRPSHWCNIDLVVKQVFVFLKMSQPPRWSELLPQCAALFHVHEVSAIYLKAPRLVWRAFFMDSGRKRHNNEGGWCDWSQARDNFWADYELGQCPSISVSRWVPSY
jgi:hypothetical protein